MKNLIAIIICGLFAGKAAAQDSNNGYASHTPKPTPSSQYIGGYAVWTPAKTICDPYHSEKDLESTMSPGVKALYNASQDKNDKLQNAVKTIYCNPPTKSDPQKAQKAN